MRKFLLAFAILNTILANAIPLRSKLVILDGKQYPYSMGIDGFVLGFTQVYSPDEAIAMFGEIGEHGAMVLATKEFAATHSQEEMCSINGVVQLSITERTMDILRIINRHFTYLGIPLLLLIFAVASLFIGYDGNNQQCKKNNNSASLGKRAVECLIDSLLFLFPTIYYCYLCMVYWPFVVGPFYAPFLYVLFVFCIIRFSYYYFFELFFARTPGKFICRTQVVSNSTTLWAKSIAIRSLCRFIPFNEYSFLYNINRRCFWHDTLSETKVNNTK